MNLTDEAKEKAKDATMDLYHALERVEMIFTFWDTMSMAGRKIAIDQARKQSQAALAKARGEV